MNNELTQRRNSQGNNEKKEEQREELVVSSSDDDDYIENDEENHYHPPRCPCIQRVVRYLKKHPGPVIFGCLVVPATFAYQYFDQNSSWNHWNAQQQQRGLKSGSKGGGTFMVFVTNAAGSTVAVDLPADATLADLRAAAVRTEVPNASHGILTSGGGEFFDDDTLLADTGLASEARVTFVPNPLRGSRETFYESAVQWGSGTEVEFSKMIFKDVNPEFEVKECTMRRRNSRNRSKCASNFRTEFECNNRRLTACISNDAARLLIFRNDVSHTDDTVVYSAVNFDWNVIKLVDIAEEGDPAPDYGHGVAGDGHPVIPPRRKCLHGVYDVKEQYPARASIIK